MRTDQLDMLGARACWWLFAAAATLVVATALFSLPGYLTWDAGTYHLMVRTLHATGGFFIPNGYGELSSPLLAVGQTMVKNGGLVSQYPEYYTFLSLPFYALFGYRGLMVLNALAFVGICALIWRIASWFSAERQAPLAAVGVYAVATYAIEFTQFSYPHLTSTFLVCLSVWLLWGAALGKDDMPQTLPGWVRSAESRCALAAAIFGIAIGVRLDSMFAGLALAIPFVAFRALGWRSMAACVAGVIPPLIGLAWINAVKFGVFFPFSYGRGSGGYTGSLDVYFPVAAAFLLGIALLAWHRYRPIRPGRRAVAGVLIAIALVLVLTQFGRQLIFGMFQILVDMRLRPEIPEAALTRSPGGAVVYWSNVKKSLVESCPYLILIVIPAVRGLAGGSYGPRWLLWLAPAGFVCFYGYLAWHGSVGWNMRYLNPGLPFLAILASHELLRLAEHIPYRRILFWVGVAVLWALLALAFRLTRGSLAEQEILILNGGLVLAAVLLSLQVLEMWGGKIPSRVMGRLLGGLFVVSLVWSSALTYGVDYLAGSGVRTYFRDASLAIEPKIENDALIMAFQPDYAWGLLDSGKRPIIANYTLGSQRDAIDLVEKAIDRRPLYWVGPRPDRDDISPAMFAALRSRNIRIDPIPLSAGIEDIRLYRLRRIKGS